VHNVSVSTVGALTSDSRARIREALAGRGWGLPGKHPIAALDGLTLGDYRVIALLGPKNAVGSRYFRLFLADVSGRLADEPVALGLFGAGPYPAFNWVELTQYAETLLFAQATPPRQRKRERGPGGEGGLALDLGAMGLDRPLFAALSALVPAGGHLMCEYDSPTHKATERILTLRYPPAASPIGYLMFEVGVRSYRDWYISEGGREGPRKLQGFKPWNEEIAAEKTAALKSELSSALKLRPSPEHGEWGRLARDLAARALAQL
jgi:Protein of unknown function (DUF1122)